MKIRDLGNICGINGYPLNSTTLEKYERICRRILEMYGKIDLKTIDEDDSLEAGVKKDMIAAAFVHLNKLGEIDDSMKQYAKECSARCSRVDFLKKGTGKILAGSEMREIYVGELQRYEKFGGYKNAVRLMFAAAYGIQPPLRIAEYHNAIVVLDDAELAKFTAAAINENADSYAIKDSAETQYFNILHVGNREFTININKTAKRSGQRKIPISPEFGDALKIWRTEFDKIYTAETIPWMCADSDGNVISDSSLTKKITAVFGVPPTSLRHSAVVAADIEDRRDLAKMMLHSVEISELYYNRHGRFGAADNK